VRGAQQRGRSRPIRPARRSLADRDAAVPARPGPAGSTSRMESRAVGVLEPARSGGPARACRRIVSTAPARSGWSTA
jgi:hypothetical protein